MVKGILRFAETGVLVSAILGIYGFTFLTVFSLNPRVENVVADSSLQTSILGTSTINVNSIAIENISEDTDDFKTSLERSGDNSYILTLSFLNNGEKFENNLISLSNEGTENVSVSYILNSENLNFEGLTFIQENEIFDFNNVEKLYTYDLESEGVEQLGINLQRGGEGDSWTTIKIIIEY